MKLKYFTLLFLFLTAFTSNSIIAQGDSNDCVNSITICGNEDFTSNVSGIGTTQEILNYCSGSEHNSKWLKIIIAQAGTLGFNLIPDNYDITVDYDFWVFGPNKLCNALGSPIRCCTTNSAAAGLSSNWTGMNDSTLSTTSGPGAFGTSFVSSINVIPGEIYYIAIDRSNGTGGFTLQWTGSATAGTGAFAPLPVANTIPDYKVCSNTPDMGIFDLNTRRSLINPDSDYIGHTGSTVINFYTSISDALNQAIPFPNVITNTTNPQAVYARVTNKTTNCFSISSFNLEVISLPDATISGTTTICQGSSAVITFTGTPNAIVTYTVDSGPILIIPLNSSGVATATTSNLNTTLTYNLVSVTNGSCSQPLTGSAVITVVPAPVITNPTSYVVCDDNYDGVACLFDLHTKDIEISPAPGTVTSYYRTLVDSQNGINPIAANPYCNINSAFSQILYVRVVDPAAPACASFTTLTLIVNPRPNISYISDYVLCDSNNPGDGKEVFYLSVKDTEIMNGQTPMSVSYYLTQADAINQVSPLPSSYTNTTSPQTIWYSITNMNTGCPNVGSFNLVVSALPLPLPLAPYTVCAYGNPAADGLGEFDLSALTPNIVYQTPGVYTVTYHKTQGDATSGSNSLPLIYHNTTPFVEILWMRAQNPTTGCFSVMSVELDVSSAPVIPNLNPIVKSDTDNNTQDGCTAFNLSAQTPIILAAQSGPAANYAVTYYASLNNASSGNTPILSENNYVSCGTNTIWVRVTNIVTGCFNVGSFQLQVKNPTLLSQCDADANPNDLFTTFDMCSYVETIPGSTLQFYLDSALTQPIPCLYTNQVPSAQTVYLVITDDATGNKSYSTLTLEVLPIPKPKTDPAPLLKCINNGNGGFDLTTNAAYILNSDANATLHYYASQLDAIANVNEIITPTAANVDQNVWIRVESKYSIDSNNEHCYVLVEQPITINTLPTATISGTTTIEPNATAVLTFTGTPNARVSYTVNGGDEQSLDLDSSGIYTLTTPSLSINTTYSLVTVISSVTGCSQNITSAATIYINNGNVHNDCIDASQITANDFGNTVFHPSNGIGTVQEINSCGGMEHNSVWLKVVMDQSGTFGFDLIPEDTDLSVDFDFWVFGPNKECGNIGSAIRCSTSNPIQSGLSNNHTGMNETATNATDGPSLGTGYVRWLTVTAGEEYYIVVDNASPTGGTTVKSASSNGFKLQALGSGLLLGTTNYVDRNGSVTLYPNPATNFIQINTQNSTENLKNIVIYDILGKTVKAVSNLATNQTTVDVSNLTKGVYMVEITSDADFKSIKKLIIK